MRCAPQKCHHSSLHGTSHASVVQYKYAHAFLLLIVQDDETLFKIAIFTMFAMFHKDCSSFLRIHAYVILLRAL